MLQRAVLQTIRRGPSGRPFALPQRAAPPRPGPCSLLRKVPPSPARSGLAYTLRLGGRSTLETAAARPSGTSCRSSSGTQKAPGRGPSDP
eukprot:scaffold2728_cov126-Pinguiococcus_pyrenoidosus.AAC.1